MSTQHKDKKFMQSKKAIYFLWTVGLIVTVGATMSYLDCYNAHLITTIALVGSAAGGFQGAVDSVKSHTQGAKK